MQWLKRTIASLGNSITAGRITAIVLTVAAAVIVFEAGIIVGLHKARFETARGEHYVDNFGPRPMGPIGGMPEGFPAAHGTVGKIITVNLPIIAVEGPDGIEVPVEVSETTRIRKGFDDIRAENIGTGQFIVVIGEPSPQGRIIAKLIRVLPAPPVKAP